jgi:hypothetical protein
MFNGNSWDCPQSGRSNRERNPMSQIVAGNRRISQPALLLAMAALALVACTLAVALSAPGNAAADPTHSGKPGYWAQTSCSEGSEPLNVDGWHVESTGGYPTLAGNSDTCETPGGSLGLRDEGSFDSKSHSGPEWLYEVPAYSKIAGGVLHVSVKTFNGEAYITTNAFSTPAEWLLDCSTQCANGGHPTVGITQEGGWQLWAGLMCVPPSGESVCSSGLDGELQITSATVMLRNESTPTGTGFGGTLLDGSASGTANLTFTAHDEHGPGVYRVTADLDGQLLWSGTPSLNEGSCVAYGTYDGALNFHSNQPCPQETGVSIEVPTAGIAEGEHQLKIEVEDAAGHTAVVYEHAITIANDLAAALGVKAPGAGAPVRGPANGTPASESAVLTALWKDKSGKSANALTSVYGRSHEVTGKLTTAAGAPIAGALIEASQKPASLGATASSIASTHTGTDGSFMIHVPGDASSSIQLAYRSHLGDAKPAATRTLTLQVPASLHLTVSPHVTSVRQTIVLSGKLAGPIPPGGKKVLFEARVIGGPWIEFHNATVDAHGRFRATHRFTFAGPIRYQFRVVCEREADFPFLAGSSNIVRVWER